jgi:Predicted transmembrane transcriptional regulator (anti-sigma factor)
MAHKCGNCTEIFGMLSEYLDLELPPAMCQEIDEHLATCPPCVDFVKSLRKTVDLCRQYEPSETPAPLGEAARRDLLAAYRRMLTGEFAKPEKIELPR